MRVSRVGLLFAGAMLACASAQGATEKWDRDIGKTAPRLVAADWVGTPVSLDALRGNTIVLAFWNADIPS